MGNTCETKLNNLHRSILEIQLFKNELEYDGEDESTRIVTSGHRHVTVDRGRLHHHSNSAAKFQMRHKQKSIDTSFYKLDSINENV